MPQNFEIANIRNDIRDLAVLKGFTILAVDNDQDILVLITDILEAYGIQVLTALSAISALEMIKQFPVDLLISDINMPGEDGYWLIQKVRMLTPPQKREIPAIAFTGNAKDKVDQKARESGFQTYLQKPSTVDKLVTEIAKLLQYSGKSSPL
ncbi:response regulator [Anabaena sp. UHCC 0399]|uniref:response regulator n=1 Tax=Anabaena sp. UHCC 0399 TaxID=3110238 RepID=UPI002B1F0BDC|nr:response regulator [Anabaena sp. UHCC 0399]MEA5565960.1 response regulator [Anabaena sp. UHCC 0399]